jgi:asparagine synthase (glutamine-hydrolysing)
MCGIFYYQLCSNYSHGARSRTNSKRISTEKAKLLFSDFAKIQHRGPDNSQFQKYISPSGNTSCIFGFHRLAINGLGSDGNQPFVLGQCRLICNGEIYNFKQLIKEYGLEDVCKSESDCEVILHLYKRIGIEAMLNALDGVFALVLYDGDRDKTYIARDPFGVRSLFIGTEINIRCTGSLTPGQFSVSSEMKALSHCAPGHVAQFPSGCYFEYDNTVCRGHYFPYYKYLSLDMVNIVNVKTTMTFRCGDSDNYNSENVENVEKLSLPYLRELLVSAVTKRLMSNRPIGALLSGGLDSSLVTAIICRLANVKKGSTQLNTYSIGLAGSVDLFWAKRVAEFLGTNHHEVCVTEAEFLDAIEDTIAQVESYDTTTIRASVGNYLVSKYIAKTTDDVVIYCGDMSDEIFGSYRGFCNAKTDCEFEVANERMVSDVRFFDLLRSDKSISGCGLEARVPFADKKLVEYVMRVDPNHKRFNTGSYIEKSILRCAFDALDETQTILPSEVLWRKKEAFSDGVSPQPLEVSPMASPVISAASASKAAPSPGKTTTKATTTTATATTTPVRTWIDMIRDYVDARVSDEEYAIERTKIVHNTPYDKESYYYRRVFEKLYPGREHAIPYFWRHPFCAELDPSARLLNTGAGTGIGTRNGNLAHYH